MHVRTLVIALAAASSCLGQTLVTDSGHEYTAELRPLLNEDGTTLQAMRGIWRARGYSYLARVTEKEAEFYNETRTLLWPSQDVDADDLLVVVSTDGKQAKVTHHPDAPPFVVDRIDSMPVDAREPDSWTPDLIFAVFSDTMTERYVFFEEREFDWPSRVAKYRPMVTKETSDADLFDAMAQSLEGLDDGHVQLGATIDGESRRAELGTPPTMLRGYEVFQQQTEFKEFGEFVLNRRQTFESGIATRVLGGKAQQDCEELVWGKTDANVGYLRIGGMGGFSQAESLEEQLAELHQGLHKILTELADTDAMIVDVATNGGGSDIFSLAIASHFADTRRLAFTKGPRDVPEIVHSVFVEPFQHGGKTATYTKPVYLVTTDITMSAAEIFVLAMKDFPHVTTVGTATRGALSDVLSKTLPNGWAFGLSNEIYRDSMGVCWEAKGIPPRVRKQILDSSKPDLGHAAAILEIANSHR